MTSRAGSPIRRVVALSCVLLLPVSLSFAQQPGPPTVSAGTQQAAPILSPDQLSNLVAPIALYPDPLLGQVLAASTYPVEIVEAQQWLQKNGNLSGSQLMDAAKQQNWDPSIQALVAFPDALNLLSNDIRWTTDLGNAFLAQQSDVMRAVQGMRARAQANGRLSSTPQQVVTTDTQDNQSAIEIQPADPQVMYVPVYDPAYVWGPPAWGAYPDLWYPGGFGFGFGFGPGIYIGSFFTGWGGWGGWGWGCGWFGNGLFVNTGFFNRYGFHGGFGGGFRASGFGGRGAWAHDPGHRMGVPYSNRTVASRFNSTRFNGSEANGRQFSDINRGNTGQSTGVRANGGASASGWRTFNGDNRTAASSTRPASSNFNRGGEQGLRSAPSYNRSSASAYSGTRAQSYAAPRSYSSSPSRSFAASPSRSFSSPRSYSAPRSSGGGFSGGHSGSSGAGHSGGGGHRR
jgi:hypothetical protein